MHYISCVQAWYMYKIPIIANSVYACTVNFLIGNVWLLRLNKNLCNKNRWLKEYMIPCVFHTLTDPLTCFKRCSANSLFLPPKGTAGEQASSRYPSIVSSSSWVSPVIGSHTSVSLLLTNGDLSPALVQSGIVAWKSLPMLIFLF